MITKTVRIDRKRLVTGLAVALASDLHAGTTFAWQTPTGLRADDDRLRWDSDAPSFNIYEDGLYIATVHGQTSFEPIFDNSVYRVVSHDHGMDFSPLSATFLYVDESGDGDVEDEELVFAETEIYFELNNTDGDLGIHSKVDGDTWTSLAYEDVNGRTLIEITLTGSMALQGLTELFFESAEPTFDEVSPAEFFARFPAGTYGVEGVTLDGEAIEGETQLSHVIPAAPVVYIGAGATAPLEGCEDNAQFDPAAALDVDGSLPVYWDPVIGSHADIGTPGPVDVVLYQLVVETENAKLTVDLDADTTHYAVPAALVGSGDPVKMEVIVRDATHNQVGTEACANVI